MFAYLGFPVLAYVVFNHPYFFERAMNDVYHQAAIRTDFDGVEKLAEIKAVSSESKIDSLMQEFEGQDSRK